MRASAMDAEVRVGDEDRGTSSTSRYRPVERVVLRRLEIAKRKVVADERRKE